MANTGFLLLSVSSYIRITSEAIGHFYRTDILVNGIGDVSMTKGIFFKSILPIDFLSYIQTLKMSSSFKPGV